MTRLEALLSEYKVVLGDLETSDFLSKADVGNSRTELLIRERELLQPNSLDSSAQPTQINRLK